MRSAVQVTPLHGDGHSLLELAQEFLEHAGEEQAHADEIAERITQLGGRTCSITDTPSMSKGAVVDMIREDLVSERVAIESYSEIIRHLGKRDSTSRRMLEGV